MKAFTLKKAAAAVALLAVAGSASAASDVTLKSLGLSTDGPVTETAAAALTNLPLQTAATEDAKRAAVALTAEADDVVVRIALPSQAIAAGSILRFNFTGGGLDTAQTYTLIRGTSANDNGEAAPVTLYTRTVDSAQDVVTTLAFQVNTGQTIAQSDVLYLVKSDALATADNAATGIDFVNDKGIVFKGAKNGAYNSNVAMSFSVDHSDASISDAQFSATAQNIGKLLDGIRVVGFTAVNAQVDFAQQALKFVNGTGVTNGVTTTTSGFTTAAQGYTVAGGVYSKSSAAIGGSVVGLTDAPNLAHYVADVTISMNDCSALTTNTAGTTITGITLANSGAVALSRVAGQCQWTANNVAVNSGLTVTNTVTGKAELGANTVTMSYDIDYVNSGTVQDDIIAGKSSRVASWLANVQVNGGAKSFPLLAAANNNPAAFSLIKFDNKGYSSATDVVLSGMVEQIEFVDGEAVSTFIPFSNYKLNKQFAARSLAQVTGDDVIDSLLGTGGFGSEDFGYNTSALEGLKKDALHNISVTFAVSTAETPFGGLGKTVGYNATTNGRIGVAAQ